MGPLWFDCETLSPMISLIPLHLWWLIYEIVHHLLGARNACITTINNLPQKKKNQQQQSINLMTLINIPKYQKKKKKLDDPWSLFMNAWARDLLMVFFLEPYKFNIYVLILFLNKSQVYRNLRFVRLDFMYWESQVY